jgi:hypothetical protein
MRTRLKTEEYFPKEFTRDVEVYFTVGSCYCGKPIASISNSNEILNTFLSPIDFFVVLYEITLLSEVIYTYFNSSYDKFFKHFPNFPGEKCQNSSSLGVIHFAKNIQTEMDINNEDILKWDRFFMNYLDELFQNNNFGELTLDALIRKIKSDPDCSRHMENLTKK